MASTRFLVTGGAGFIGSHLVDALLAAGHSVVAIDNLSTGRLQNLDQAGHHDRFRFVQGSVLDELLVDELIHQTDVVIHLAAAVGVKLIVDEPLRSFTTNVRGSEIITEASHRYRKRLFVASTSEIYGKNSAGPLREDSDRILGNPSISRWAYSTAKAVDEILAFAYHRERGLETTVLRFFNTVGPRQSASYGMVIPSLVKQAVRGETITVYGSGTQTRCFAHVLDVVQAILGLIATPGSIGEAFNIGASEEISILDLAHEIVRVTGSRSDVVLVPYEQAYGKGFEDMQRRVPDTGKIRALTGWLPQRTLGDILRETVAEARLELQQPSS